MSVSWQNRRRRQSLVTEVKNWKAAAAVGLLWRNVQSGVNDLLSAVYSVCPLRWFRISNVLRVDVAEDDRTVRKSVPESIAAGATIRTDVCDGGPWGVSGGISTRLPRRWCSWMLVPLWAISNYYQNCPPVWSSARRVVSSRVFSRPAKYNDCNSPQRA